jgi:hypothetical protein
MDIVAVVRALGDNVRVQASRENGGFLLSVKAWDKHLGLSIGVVYELLNRSELPNVMLGTRKYIGQDQISVFIEANTHTGYRPSW